MSVVPFILGLHPTFQEQHVTNICQFMAHSAALPQSTHFSRALLLIHRHYKQDLRANNDLATAGYPPSL